MWQKAQSPFCPSPSVTGGWDVRDNRTKDALISLITSFLNEAIKQQEVFVLEWEVCVGTSIFAPHEKSMGLILSQMELEMEKGEEWRLSF